MWLHWLAIAVAVAGTIPVRICTCGAHLHAPFPRPLAAANIRPAPADQPTLDSAAGQEQHDPDCHYVRPRPLMPPGCLTTPESAPTDAAAILVPALPDDSASAGNATGPIPGSRHPPPNDSLHIWNCCFRN